MVGLGGLLDTPEVRDLVSALRLVADPLAGPAAVRLLTGARWRLGVADLAALWARARELVPRRPPATGPHAPTELALGALPGEHAEQAGLVDALDDPGPAAAYSPDGFARITPARPRAGLAALPRVGAPLTDLVADAERVLLLDAETAARPGPVGRAHLDAFADVVAEFATGAEVATLPALLDYLQTAEQAEDGLSPGEVEVTPDRVQVLTVHAAKGLEWEVVAVPHLVSQVFPGRKIGGTWLTSPAELPVAAARRRRSTCPTSSCPTAATASACENAVKAALRGARRAAAGRGAAPVLRRAHPGRAGAAAVRAPLARDRREAAALPSEFLVEAGRRRTAPRSGPTSRTPTPSTRPRLEQPTALWPADPLGARSADVHAGAELVHAAAAGAASTPGGRRRRSRRPAPAARPRAAARAGRGGSGGLGGRRRRAARRAAAAPGPADGRAARRSSR